jgi:hypothetical protein
VLLVLYAVLASTPRPAPPRLAYKAGDKAKARAYAMRLREIANNAQTSEPELAWARVYLGGQ